MRFFLEPFVDITKHVEELRHPTLLSVVPMHNKLLNFLEDWANTNHGTKKNIPKAKASFEKLDEYYSETCLYTVHTTRLLTPTLFPVLLLITFYLIKI